MKIIIEGPDNVGKQTLIRGLIKEFKLPFIVMNSYAPPKLDTPYDLESFHKKMYKQMFDVFNEHENVISDRFYPGAYVYQKLYNRGIDGNFVLQMEEELLKDKFDKIILIVLIDTPENLVEREDGLSIETDISYKIKEVDLYKQFFELSKLENKFLINVKDLSKDDLLEFVIKQLKEKYE